MYMYSFDTISEASAVDVRYIVSHFVSPEMHVNFYSLEIISNFQQQDLLSNVSDFETPAINPPSPDAAIETASKDIVEPVNTISNDTIMATEQIETNHEKFTTLKKVS